MHERGLLSAWFQDKQGGVAGRWDNENDFLEIQKILTRLR